jgi:tetratricopeptide (TPR) repeat protein
MKNILTICALFFSITLVAQVNMKDIDNLIASERFDDAYNSLVGLKSTSPQNSFIYFALGETVLKSYLSDPYSESKVNVLKKAKGFFTEGVKKDSLNPLNYVGLGILELFKNSDSTKADFYFNKANQLIPTKKKKLTDVHVNALLKLETAELYSNTPRYNKSEMYYNKLVEMRPKLPNVYIGYGDVFIFQSKASDAIAQYKRALYLENTALINVLVARIYYMARNMEESIKYYESALKLDSLFAPAYKGLGDVYYKLNKNRLAKTNYARFLELTGNNIPAKINYLKALYKVKDYDEAVNVGEEILKVDSSKTYIYRILAYSLTDKSKPDMEKALKYIQGLFSKIHDDDIIIKDYSYYSKILLDLKRDKEDIRLGGEMLEKAYLADTTDNDMLVDLIKTAYRNKLYDLEIKYLSKKVKEGDSTVGNYVLLGKANYYNKNHDKAHEVFQKVEQLDSLNVEACQWDAYTMLSLDPDLKEWLAKPAFEKLLAVTEANKDSYLKERYEAYSFLGSYYMFSKDIDYEKAIENIKKSLELDLKNDQWQLKGYYSLAYVYYKSKQWVNAKTAYETVLKLKPDDANAPKALRDINKYLSSTK